MTTHAPLISRPGKCWAVHLARVALLAAVLWVIHSKHTALRPSSQTKSLARIPIERIQPLYPTAATYGTAEPSGALPVIGVNGQSLGFIVQTAPASEPFLGFSGPSNLLVAFDVQSRILGTLVLSSRDTRDHVALIERDGRFLKQWTGLSWEEAARRTEIDGVTGATLTSLAMAQGLQRRLGATHTATKFPHPLTTEDALALFPLAASVQPDLTIPTLWQVNNANGQRLGSILRTSPAADEIIGFQGPTESRIGIHPDGTLTAVTLGGSFDNEPYVTYVRDDTYFLELFKRYPLPELARLDLEKHHVEGVSGATMTSIAVARSLVRAAADLQERKAAAHGEPAPRPSSRWRELLTVSVVLFGIILGSTRWRGVGWLRRLFQGVVVLVLGVLHAELLSMAMFVGWAQSGVPWTSALGLVVLSAAALIVPITTGQNVYCSHLCPHGAVQQLLPRRWRSTKRMPRRLYSVLMAIRPALLLWVIFVATTQATFHLVDIEPFDAYAWRAAAWPTLAVAVVGLVASLFVPMAYCRMGCPTGVVLNYVRRHSRSDQLSRADSVAAACLIMGILLGMASDNASPVSTPAAAASAPLSLDRVQGRTMGTTWSLTIRHDCPVPRIELERTIQHELNRLEKVFSLYQADSELSRWNQSEPLLDEEGLPEWMTVSRELAQLAAWALELSQKTGGVYDPTMGPMWRLWQPSGLHSDPRQPTHEQQLAARERTGAHLIEVRQSPPAIRKRRSGLELDLNAVVEGYALDRLAGLLKARGVHDALIELGGEYWAHGSSAPDQRWRIGIEDARELGVAHRSVTLQDQAISTSAITRQPTHLIDPRSGTPITTTLKSVSVIAPSALLADSWATALMILGPVEGRSVAERENLQTVFQE
ncbi:MAG: FMN-binding protein [Planctomycetota bacterium]|nr:MAG: FMN-binding protein [Planctomycetota bacterium]